MMLRVASLATLVAATVGCSTIDSEDIETSGINAAMEVARTAEGSNVSVSLSAGTLNFVSLNNGDVLKASALGQTVELGENNVLNAISYFGRLDANAQGDEVTVAFERTDKTSAPASTVKLPATVEITAPAAGAAFSRDTDDIVVEITGEESTDGLRLSWSGDCVDADGLDVPADQTSVTINAGTIKKRAQVDENDPDSEPVADSCTVAVRVERRVTGTLDGEFKGGGISAVTSSSRDITSNL
jgi:hypothetical protein